MGISNRVLTDRSQTFPDEPIRVRAQILFPIVSQRTDFDNSGGHRRPLSVAEGSATGRLFLSGF
jgi:hypothetical protein